MTQFHPVCRLAELAPLTPLSVDVDGEWVAVVRIEDEVYAISDVCSHAEIALSEGTVDLDRTLSCWLHGSRFDLRTGEPLDPPACQPVPVYPTKITTDADGVATVAVSLTEEFPRQERAV